MPLLNEHPIVLGAHSVRTTLLGIKTQTRRVIKPTHLIRFGWLKQYHIKNVKSGRMRDGGWHMDHPWAGKVFEGAKIAPDSSLGWIRCPYGTAGNKLWVREQFQPLWLDPDPKAHRDYKTGEGYCINYLATDGRVEWDNGSTRTNKYKSPIYMPKWASRITLDIVSIRVERLKDISEEDAIAEGVSPHVDFSGVYSARDNYQDHWDDINRKLGFGWEENPWVWVVEYSKVEEGVA